MNPPKFVEVATSGAVVTRYFLISSFLLISLKTLPNTSWVDVIPVVLTPVSVGKTKSILEDAVSRAKAFARCEQSSASAEPGANKFHSSLSVKPLLVRKSFICASLNNAE